MHGYFYGMIEIYLNLATLHSSGCDSSDVNGQCLIKLIVLKCVIDTTVYKDIHGHIKAD